MGRITIFTRTDVEECQQAEQALEKLQIPYKAISLERWPDRNEDLLSLTGSSLVPAVFFNELFVGGLSGLLNEIVAWYSSQYETPRHGYNAEVKAKKSPSDARLRLPTAKESQHMAMMMIQHATNEAPFNAPEQVPKDFPDHGWRVADVLDRDEPSSQDDKRKKKNKKKSGGSKKKTKERRTKSLSPPPIARSHFGAENHPSVLGAEARRMPRDASFVDRSHAGSGLHTYPPPFPRSMSSRSQKSSSAQTFPPSSQRNLKIPKDMGVVDITEFSSFDDAASHVGSVHKSRLSRLNSGQPKSRPELISNDSVSTITEATSIGQATVKSTVVLPNGSQVSVMVMTECLKTMLPCEDLKYHLTMYKRCFRVKDAIAIFQSSYDDVKSEADAISFGRALQRAGVIRHVADDSKPFQHGDFYFRLWCYQYPDILNYYRRHGELFYGSPMELITYLFELLGKVETDSTTQVDLVDFRRASSSFYFPLLEDTLCLLQGLDLGTLEEDSRLAAAINLYNIMVRFAFMKVGVPTSRAARNNFFSVVKMNIGGDVLSFNDLEHGILRANRAPPGVSAGPPFGSKDPRGRLALKALDHRIHFVLNCNPTTATPTPLNPETIHGDLQSAGKMYMSKYTNIMIDSSNHTVHLNQIFQWYRSDFANGDHKMWPGLLIRYLDEVKKRQMRAMMGSGKSPSFEFNEFDWGMNAGNFHPFVAADLKVNEKRLL